jgi:hypothetical protein
MDNVEARRILAAKLDELRRLSYHQLVDRLLDREETSEVTGTSAVRYQLELQGFWDSQPDGVLRVLGCVDDGGFRAFVPLTDSFLVAPDGSFIGE